MWHLWSRCRPANDIHVLTETPLIQTVSEARVDTIRVAIEASIQTSRLLFIPPEICSMILEPALPSTYTDESVWQLGSTSVLYLPLPLPFYIRQPTLIMHASNLTPTVIGLWKRVPPSTPPSHRLRRTILSSIYLCWLAGHQLYTEGTPNPYADSFNLTVDTGISDTIYIRYIHSGHRSWGGWTILEKKVPLADTAPCNVALMRHWIIEILGWGEFSNDNSLTYMRYQGFRSEVESIWPMG